MKKEINFCPLTYVTPVNEIEIVSEMERLLTKMSEINPYKYKEQTYSDDDEQMEM